LLALDLPNERSLHERPTPRGGGLGIAVAIALCGFAVVWVLDAGAPTTDLAVSLTAVAVVSHADDRCSLSPFLRLFVHIAAALWWVGSAGPMQTLALPGVVIELGPVVGTVVSVLTLVWLTNLYNFMDGMDGFAAGMGVVGFSTVGVLVLGQGMSSFALVAVAAGGGCGGFLCLNFPPAKIFMGDVGSSLLGFLAGALLLGAQSMQALPLWVGLLVFSPFVVDATVTLIRRLVRGERIWEPHQSHYYQRLVRLGWGHKRTVLAEYVIMLACAGSALAVMRLPVLAQWGMLTLWAAAYVALMVWVTCLERHRQA
jgi:UDP-N-acetylmuramyl pentapeptide phosphotransferase/UDP-N-acetylglucosamine-1-phosphate transferase